MSRRRIFAVLFALLIGQQAADARADLPLIDGNLQVTPWVPAAPFEASADILLRLPGQVDGKGPVPLNVRVLQDSVEAITLMTDTLDPEQLAKFELAPSVIPELWTRFVPDQMGGVLVLVHRDQRIYAARRTFSTVPVESFVLPEESDGLEQTESEPPDFAFLARREGDRVRVSLRALPPLLDVLAMGRGMPENSAQSAQLEIEFDGEALVKAELGPLFAQRPYLAFQFRAKEFGQPVILRWQLGDNRTRVLETPVIAEPSDDN
ncbi:MAG: hypothetical protein CMI01_16195 [Oceanospirillaceae bacterium]|nr:hypothetical protein [Oceanospirillaceae bacterium]